MRKDRPTWFEVGEQGTRLRAIHADSFWSRARGLLGRAPLEADQALWIRPCNSVHTFGMSYPIDVVFLDREQCVVRVVHQLQKRRMAATRRAHSTLELRGGVATRLNIVEGLRIKVAS